MSNLQQATSVTQALQPIQPALSIMPADPETLADMTANPAFEIEDRSTPFCQFVVVPPTSDKSQPTIPQLRIFQEMQEDFEADGLDIQIVLANYKPLTNLEENIVSMTESTFIPADAPDIPFGMFDEAYAITVINMDVHVQDAEGWKMGDQTPDSPDSVLLSPKGEIVAHFSTFDGSDWHTDEVKDFILDNILCFILDNDGIDHGFRFFESLVIILQAQLGFLISIIFQAQFGFFTILVFFLIIHDSSPSVDV